MISTYRQRAAIAMAALIFTLAACGGGGSGSKVASIKGTDASSSSGGGNSSDSKATFQDALLEHSRCMREHGIDMPDPTFTDNGAGATMGIAVGGDPSKMLDPTSQVFKDAETACKPILDKVEQSMPKPSAEEQARMQDQALAFAKCMRDNGFDMPDPTFGDNGTVAIQIGGPPDDASDGTDSDAMSGGPMTRTPDPAFLEASKKCGQETGGIGIGSAQVGG